MAAFVYKNGILHADAVSLLDLALRYGTPLYVYSARALREQYQRLARAFAPLNPFIHYAVKANGNLALLRLLKAEGAGFDIVSGGELYRALKAGADPAQIAFAGVGKTDAELVEALEARIGWFNVESSDELARLNVLAETRGLTATIAVRLNPNVEANTHAHIQTGEARHKFGVTREVADKIAATIHHYPAVRLRGVHIHIGSQLPTAAPLLAALEVALDFARRTPSITHLNFGGGFPVRYQPNETYEDIETFAAPIVKRLQPLMRNLTFSLEPGRYLVAEAGILLTTIQAVKELANRRTLVVDAGMHTLLRPALYDAYHHIRPITQFETSQFPLTNVVGPICESADVLGLDRVLPQVTVGDVLAIYNAGAYGFSMASNYNAQPRPAEILVEGDTVKIIRRRENYADLLALESEA